MLKNDFSCPHYWDGRYILEEHKEWLADYAVLKPLLASYLKPLSKILILGCGNSSLTADLYFDGYVNITSVDFSREVIEKMKSKWKDYPTLKWLFMDIRELNFPEKSFDVVIDKATLDALIVQSWTLSDHAKASVSLVCREVSRVLLTGGVFLSITFAQPHFRIPIYALDRYEWSVEVQSFGQDFAYFFYAMTKGRALYMTALENLLYPYYYAQRVNECNDSISQSEDDENFLLQICL